MYAILDEQEVIFWPQQKRQKSYMKRTRKNSDDPLIFLPELQKKAKFCRISQIIDRVECNHCHEKVKVNPNDERATEKFIILVYFNSLTHNDFAAYITEELGRAKEEAKFEEINRLSLQYTLGRQPCHGWRGRSDFPASSLSCQALPLTMGDCCRLGLQRSRGLGRD